MIQGGSRKNGNNFKKSSTGENNVDKVDIDMGLKTLRCQITVRERFRPGFCSSGQGSRTGILRTLIKTQLIVYYGF